jgi:methionyl-tRNA synthetase
MMDDLVVVTATAPTPNGSLHVGHLSGPFIAADVAARAARARGLRTLTVSGLDPHQNYVLAKAAKEGRTPEAMLDDYEELVRASLRAARISFDVFADPRADAGYRNSVARLLSDFSHNDMVRIEPFTLFRCGSCQTMLHYAYVSGSCARCGAGSSGGTCEACGGYTTAENLDGARCGKCGGAPEAVTEKVPLLRLESCRAELTEVWSRAVLPASVRALLRHYLTAGLPDVPLAYPSDWGIASLDADGQRIDVWVEMGLGLLAGIGRRIDPAASTVAAYRSAWRGGVAECWHFLGIDNAFYFGVLFPALFAAAGIAPGWLGGLVVNGFYRLDGLKFSTSRNHAVWAHEFLAEQDPAMVRMFLCWDRPDRYESGFTHQGYAGFRDWVGPLLRAGGGGLPPELAEAEVRRAGHALEFGAFDPGLALRCLLAAGPDRAPDLLAAITGGSDAVC